MSSNSQQSTSESTTSPSYINQPITTEAVTTIINNAIQTNGSFTATLSQPHLVALSDQTKVQELGTKDMEINDPCSKANRVMIKEEDKDNSTSTLTLKHVSPLPSTEPTELSRMVPGTVQCTETIFTGMICTGGEEFHDIPTSNQSVHNDRSEDLSHQLTLWSNGRFQPPTDHHQPLLELPIAGSKNFHLPYRSLTTYQHFLD